MIAVLAWALGIIPMEVGSWLAPTVISSGIAGAVALATHFSAQSAKKTETREDIRTEAFDQAKAYYVDVIDRQDKEIATLRGEVAEAIRRASAAETTADASKAAVRKLTDELRDRDRQIEVLTDPSK